MAERICGNCVYWKPTEYEYSVCSEIYDALDIEIEAGWSGGYVSSIETDIDFGCNRFEAKTSSAL